MNENVTVEQEYTVQIQAWRPDTPIELADRHVEILPDRRRVESLTNRRTVGHKSGLWQAVAPAETVAYAAGAADELADQVAANQNVVAGEGWRVRVWEGADADTAAEPAAEHVVDQN